MHRLRLKPHVRRGDFCSWVEWEMSVPRLGGRHAHQDFRELFWVLAGRGVHWINGLELPLQPRQLVFVHDDDQHALAPLPGERLQFVNLAFPSATWTYLTQRYWQRLSDPFEADAAGKMIHLAPPDWSALSLAAEELRGGSRGQEATERFLLNLRHLLDAAAGQDSGAAPSPALPAWLQRAMEQLVQEDLLQEGLPAFLRLCGRSREHVARVVRKLLRQSPTELVNDARLAEAARYLSQSDRSIIDISLACGFGHLGHFYKEFGRRYHATPRRYRLCHHQLIRGPRPATGPLQSAMPEKPMPARQPLLD